MLADLYERKRPRGPHGLPLDEVTDGANRGRYVAEKPLRDLAQEALNVQKDAYRKAYPDADLDSLLWRVRKLDD